MKRMLGILWLLVMMLVAGRLEATTITSSDILRISFTTNPPFGGTTPDTLELFFSPGGFTGSGITGFGAELFDGSTLLGSYHSNSPPGQFLAPLFKSSVSPVTAGSPTVVDFTKILNGTINGRIDFHLDSGTGTFNLGNFLWDATNADGGGVSFNSWVVANVQVVPSGTTTPAPEPSSLVLLCAGLIGGGLCRYRRWR